MHSTDVSRCHLKLHSFPSDTYVADVAVTHDNIWRNSRARLRLCRARRVPASPLLYGVSLLGGKHEALSGIRCGLKALTWRVFTQNFARLDARLLYQLPCSRKPQFVPRRQSKGTAPVHGHRIASMPASDAAARARA